MSHKELTLSYFCELMMRLTLNSYVPIPRKGKVGDVCIKVFVKWLRWLAWKGRQSADEMIGRLEIME